MHTLAALRRTEQTVRCPEWRLRAQAGLSLACFCCFLCIIFPARLQSVPGQTVLVCLENPLFGSSKPCRAQKAPYIPLTMFSFPLQPNQMCPYITVSRAASPSPKCSIRPHALSCPTQMVLTNLPMLVLTEVQTASNLIILPVQGAFLQCPFQKNGSLAMSVQKPQTDLVQSISRMLGPSQKYKEGEKKTHETIYFKFEIISK